jgi:probable rRNA maturation factor
MHKQPQPKIQFHFLESTNLTNRTLLKKFIEKLCNQEGRRLEHLNYIFCSDDYLLHINQQHLQHDFYTDIITFDLSEPKGGIHGEIYISIDRVRDNAGNLNEPIYRELHRVIFHGALHLCGYNDKTQKEELTMRRKEDQYLQAYFQ